MIKNYRRVLAGLMTVGMMVGAVLALGQDDMAFAAAKKVKMSKKSISVNVGKKATVKVKNAGKNKVKATTAKKKIATVSVSGKKVVITGKKAGKTKVTVAVKGMKKAIITVTVKVVKTTAVTPVKTTGTVSQPIPDMQTIPTVPNVNNWLTPDQKKLAANMTITGKKLGDGILLCVTNNNNVAIKVGLWGEYYQDADSAPGALTSSGALLGANYIAPHGKYYGIFTDYQHKDVWYMALSDIKIGGISCDIADDRNRTDVIKTDFYRGKYGRLMAKMTESVILKENEQLDIWATYVCKDAAGKIIGAESRYFGSFYNHIDVKSCPNMPDTYASVETYYSVNIWDSSSDD